MQRGHEAANLGRPRQGLGGATNWPQGCPSQGWAVGRAGLARLIIRRWSFFPGTPHGVFCRTQKAGEEVGSSKGFWSPSLHIICLEGSPYISLNDPLAPSKNDAVLTRA